jgi:hypothetical protein
MTESQLTLMETFTPELDTFYEGPKTIGPWKKIICIVDVSGSTNNQSGRGGRRGMNVPVSDETNNLDETVKTKPIIIAELEGVAHTLSKLSNSFNLDTMFEFHSFSSNIHEGIKKQINSKDLYDISSKLNTCVVTEFGSTHTKNALVKVLTDTSVPTLFIMATDGQPNDITKAQLIDYMETIKTKFGEIRLDHIIIGAGSIMESGSCIASRTVTRTEGRYNYDDTRVQDYSECDLTFLHQFVDTSNAIGTYLPAFKDYADLKKELETFVKCVIDDVQMLSGWKVKLDENVGDLPEQISNALHFVNQNGSVIFNTPFGTYMFTKTSNNLGYQTKITNLPDLNGYNVVNTPFGTAKYSELFGQKYDQNGVHITLKKDTYYLSVPIELDSGGFARMRQIYC